MSDMFLPDQLITPNPRTIERGTRAAACLPLPILGRNRAVLWIEFREIHSFSETEKQALQLYSNQAAIAYDNARRMQELEQLRIASEAMASAQDVQEVLRQIARSARQVLGADSAVIWSYDEVRHTFVPNELIWDNLPDELVESFRYSEPRAGGTAEAVMRDGYLTVTDIDDPQYAWLSSSDLGLRGAINAKSFQGVALQVGDETLGVLYVNYCQPRSLVLANKLRSRPLPTTPCLS